MRPWKPIFAVLLFSAFVGCGKPEPVLGTVKGKVTIDAKPLASGQITFDGKDGKPPTTLDIKDGVYEGKVLVGEKVVRISAYKAGEVQKTGMTGPEYDNLKSEVNYIPARFNTESQEKRVVKEGMNEFDMAVMSK